MTPWIVGGFVAVLFVAAAVVGAIRNNRRWDRDEKAVLAAIDRWGYEPGGMPVHAVWMASHVRIDRVNLILRKLAHRGELDALPGPRYRRKTGATS